MIIKKQYHNASLGGLGGGLIGRTTVTRDGRLTSEQDVPTTLQT